MKPVLIGNGEIRVLSLAFESFGGRGMATYVETNDLKFVIDPGSALRPRFRLNPTSVNILPFFRADGEYSKPLTMQTC